MDLIGRPLGQLARILPGAIRIFHKYTLDSWRGGKPRPRQAAAPESCDWSRLTPADLIDHMRADCPVGHIHL